jgi:hypothetical protein
MWALYFVGPTDSWLNSIYGTQQQAEGQGMRIFRNPADFMVKELSFPFTVYLGASEERLIHEHTNETE